MSLKIVFVLLHVLTAAAYFGLSLGLPNWARALATGARADVAVQGGRTVRSMTGALIATFVFALVAFVLGGAFRVYGPTFHASLGLFVVLLGVHFALLVPAWNRLAAGDDAARGRLGMATGLAHTLWLVLLVLMFWPRLTVG